MNMDHEVAEVWVRCIASRLGVEVPTPATVVELHGVIDDCLRAIWTAGSTVRRKGFVEMKVLIDTLADCKAALRLDIITYAGSLAEPERTRAIEAWVAALSDKKVSHNVKGLVRDFNKRGANEPVPRTVKERRARLVHWMSILAPHATPSGRAALRGVIAKAEGEEAS